MLVFTIYIYFQFGEETRSVLIELYVKGIQRDINALNRAAIIDPKEAADIKRRLSSVFSKIADLFRNNVAICREFVLTSFSLHPTEVGLKWLEELADMTDPTLREENRCCCRSNILRNQLCEKCGLFGNVVYNATVCGGYSFDDDSRSSYNASLLHADLGLEYADCVTLVDLVNKLRPRELNWHIGWPYLKQKCAHLISFQMHL